EDRDQERLQRLLQKWGEYEQAPDAVDNARNAGEQLDRDADRTAQPHRAKLGEKDRNQNSDGHREQHRNARSDQGAVNRSQRSKSFRYRIPALLNQEVEAKCTERRQ